MIFNSKYKLCKLQNIFYKNVLKPKTMYVDECVFSFYLQQLVAVKITVPVWLTTASCPAGEMGFCRSCKTCAVVFCSSDKTYTMMYCRSVKTFAVVLCRWKTCPVAFCRSYETCTMVSSVYCAFLVVSSWLGIGQIRQNLYCDFTWCQIMSCKLDKSSTLLSSR